MSSGVLARSLALAAGLAFALAAGAASAATTVKVELWNKDMSGDMPTTMGYATPMPDRATAPMGVTATPASAPAGEVTFNVTNTSADTIHEMLVVKLDDPTLPLAYIDAENRIDEENVPDKGEVSELDPGASGALTLTLDPGTYLLLCNVPGHYAAGMWTTFEVK